jgi:hypothetical protein
MDDIFPPQKQTTHPICGLSAVFPVNRVCCVCLNYAAPATEFGHAPEIKRNILTVTTH